MSLFATLSSLLLSMLWGGGLLPEPLSPGVPVQSAAVQSASVFPDDAQARLTLIRSTGREMVLEFTVPDYAVEPDPPWHRIRIGNTKNTDEAGAPQVPVHAALLGLPAIDGLHLEIVQADFEVLHGYRLAPVPLLVSTLQDMPGAETAQYANNALYPAAPVALDGGGILRGQPVARVRFYPVLHNPVTHTSRVYRRLRVRITWEHPVSAAGAEAERTRGGPFDTVLENLPLLYAPIHVEGAGTPPPPAHAATTEQAATRLKIIIKEDGLYRVTHAALEEAGFSIDGVDPRHLHLTNQGRAISMHVQGEEDGTFDAQDALLFYGRAVTDPETAVYTAENVYWLDVGDASGARVAVRTGTPDEAAESVAQRFFYTHRAEADTNYWQNMPNGAGQDHWFWGGRLSPTTAEMPPWQEYAVDLGTVAQADEKTATVHVRLKGYTGLEHRSRIVLNGTQIDDQLWAGQSEFDHRVEVPHALLRSGENVLRIEMLDTGATVDQVLVNWMEFSYWRGYTAADDELWFASGENGVQHFEVEGFGEASIHVWDVTNADVPRRIVGGISEEISGARSDGTGATYRLRFRDDAGANRSYYAAAESRVRTPALLQLDTPSSWTSPANGADYIIVTHRDFWESAETLAAHRRTAGLRVAVVDVADIYDEFSHGLFDPRAIRHFLAHAYAEWQAPAPSYVLLLGDGYQDYRDNLQTGTRNFVPSLLFESRLFGQIPSDAPYAAVDGDDILPDLFIGRLAAQSASEARAMVDALIAYEHGPANMVAQRSALLVADDGESAFAELAGELADRLPPHYWAQTVSAATYPPGNPTADTLRAWQEGKLLVTYIGHGEYDRWGLWNDESEFILQGADVETLAEVPLAPFVTVANCLNGFFTGPAGQPSLAETLQRHPGGAVAVWAPAGLGYTSGHRSLMGALYDVLFSDAAPTSAPLTLGAATASAQLAAYASSEYWAELIQTYVFFGDPATQLRIFRSPLHYQYLPVVHDD